MISIHSMIRNKILGLKGDFGKLIWSGFMVVRGDFQRL